MTNQFRSSRSFARAAILAFVCLFSSASEAITSLVGATPGSFAVSPSGAANYTIPLAVSPGTAGMQPSLSLSYNSQGGNGLLGIGWSLNGLSGITRCPQTQAQDGVRGGINFDGNDRYCLDGQRLINVAGAYGVNGAEYRTERESYNRIISYGTAGTGPASFKVWTKSGQVMEYGVTNDSRIEAQGKSSVSVWALNKVQDTVGNYLTVTYAEDSANGQYYPTRIDYTGNASKGLTPYNSVQFTYEARPDVTAMYHAGSVMKSTVRLKNVQSYAGSALGKDYRLAYDVSVATSRSRLTGLTECAGDGVCLGTTALLWQETVNGGWANAPNYTPPFHIVADGLGDMGARFIDVNGDGLVDLVFNRWSSPGNVQAGAYLNTGTGWANAPNYTPPFHIMADGLGDMGARFEDVNGDGLVDLVFNRWFSPGNAQAGAYLNSNLRPDLLTTLTTGLGAVTHITYKPLTDNSVYAKDTGATYPTLDIQAPLYVVSTSSTSSGIGGNYVLNYKYGGMKADLNGRGLLGFRWMETTDTNDPQAKTVTQNIYRQDYPYTGMPILSTKTVNGALVNRAQNTYTAQALGGTRYAVDLTQYCSL